MWLAWTVAGVTAALAGGAIWQRLGERKDRRCFPPPGRLVPLPAAQGGHALHCLEGRQETAVGQPTVVFEAALGASSISWALVQAEVAKFAPTFAYDRAGMGWSAAGPYPRTGSRVIEELRALLRAAGIRPPVILVGHSYGGLLTRLYAARYPEEVCGLVLVDPAAPRQWIEISPRDGVRLKVGRHLARRGVWAARLGIARGVAWLATRGARRPAGERAPERDLNVKAARTVVAAITFGILGPSDRGLMTPVQKLPEEYRRPLATLWIQPKYYAALASQLEALPQLAAEVAASERLLRVPLITLTASEPTPERVAEQAEAARLSPCGRHVIVANCGHWIQLDQPAAVVAAIRSVVETAPAS